MLRSAGSGDTLTAMGKMVSIDEALLAEASEAAGTSEAEAVVAEALHALIQREASRRLYRLKGSLPDLVASPRRRFPPE